MTAATTPIPEFDPAAITEELVVSLTGARLREVLAHYKLPDPPKSATKADLIAWATIAIRAAQPPAAISAAPEPEIVAPVELEPVPHGIIPEASKWQQIVSMGEYLARADLTPKALRGKPHDVATVLLGANDLGIPLTQALNKLIVIEGKLSMAAELMVALVLRDGHSIKPSSENNSTRATAICRRANDDETVTVTYTIEEAVDAGLVALREGKPYARSSTGNRLPWEKYTADMLWARCVSRACRRMFPDCLAGVSYTPDELGYIDAEPVEDDRPKYGRAGETEPTMTAAQTRADIARRIAELPEELRDELRKWWTSRNFPKPERLPDAALRTILPVLAGFEERAAEAKAAAEAHIDDAEIVTESGSPDDTQNRDGNTGEALPPQTASEYAPAGEPATDETPFCAGCGEQLTDPPVFDDQGAAHHVECLGTL